MTYGELKEAMAVLSIPPLSTYKEIKQIYKREVRKNHPDLNPNPSKNIDEINRAYAIVRAYIENYRFYFTVDEFENQFPEERHVRRWFKP